jgi:hypothetical protein
MPYICLKAFVLRHRAAMLDQGQYPRFECVAVTYDTGSLMVEWARGTRLTVSAV